MHHFELALALMALVGLTLGLFGGGGSILAVPVLVYVAGRPPAEAITLSLCIVGTSSLIGSFAHHRSGAVVWRVAALFGGAGMATAFVGGRLTRYIPPRALLLSFALLMLAVGVWMIIRARKASKEDDTTRPPRTANALVAGAVVGAVTGLLGVGGGFMIVPALIAFTGLDMRRAVGTSLVIIAINSAAALLGHLGSHRPDLGPALAFTAVAVVAALLGQQLGRKIPAARLRVGFALFVISVAIAMLARLALGG